MSGVSDDPVVYAQKYVEDLLSFFGLNTVVEASKDDEVIHISVPSSHMNGFLIGSRAETMRSLQSLVGAALRNQGFDNPRVNLDIADYKKQRQERLAEEAKDWVAEVKESGQPKPLAPMNAADRRTIHQVAAEHGLATESVGEGRERHIVLKPVASGSE